MRIYMAGPIAGMPSLDAARANFNDSGAKLVFAGYSPVNPMNVEPQCGEKCSGPRDHNTDPSQYHARSCYLRYDIIEMLLCDGVAMVPGWFNSVGANKERDIARHCGLPVFELEQWIEKAEDYL